MRTQESTTDAGRQYSEAHAAHYGDDDLLGALRGYGAVIESHPDSLEAGYSRTQILALVNRVVPKEELLASHTAMVLRHLKAEADRSADPVRGKKQSSP